MFSELIISPPGQLEAAVLGRSQLQCSSGGVVMVTGGGYQPGLHQTVGPVRSSGEEQSGARQEYIYI